MLHSRFIRFFSLIIILLATLAPCLYSEQVPLIPREVLFGNPEKALPSLSPDGTKLGYLAPDANGVLNVWVRDLSAKATDDIKVTSDQKRGIRNYLWQYDNDHLLYIQDQDGDENSHLYQVNLKTRETRDLTPFDGVRAQILDYSRDFPDQLLVELNKRDKSVFDVYRLNLTDGSLTLDTENKNGELQWLADYNLQVRASQAYTSDGGYLIRVRDTIEAPWRELLSAGPEENNLVLVNFSKDGQSLYLISSLDSDTGRLVKMDLATKKQQVIVEDPNYDISEVMVNPTTQEIEAVGIEKDRFEWTAIDKTIADDFKRLEQKGAIFKVTSQDLDGKKWVVAYLYDNRSPQLYVYDRATKKKEFLFTPRPNLSKYTLSKMEPISYKARDGMEIHGYLTLPQGIEAKNLPTVVMVHGGPQVRDTWGYDAKAQWLANRGYAVLQVNYRGSSGYGKKFLNAGNREWGAKMQDDLLDGKQWLIAKGYADPEKVAIFGGSYGGYAVLVGLAFTPEEFCCGVDIVGPSNLITLSKSMPSYWIPAKARINLRYGDVETEPEFLKSRSPFFKADKIVKPLLIAQGANDPRVKQAESDQIVDEMRKNNKPVEYLLFPDEGHGFARPENQFKFYAATEQFLVKYLGGRGQLPAPQENWDALKK
jgi:dipeptidyl aminopeptidase/acylaminoacyl peptidase